MIEIFSPNSLLGPHKSLTIAGLHSGEWAVILELDQRELRLSGLLIDEVVIVLKIQIIRIPLIRLTNTNLGWDVETVSLLSIELGGVQDDGDLALQDHEDHRVLVCAAHTLGAVTLDPDKKTLSHSRQKT